MDTNEAIKLSKISADHNVINYLKEISKNQQIQDEVLNQNVSTNENEQSFLEKQYNLMTLIKEDSILNNYINQTGLQPIENDAMLIYPFKFNRSQLQATRNAFHQRISVIAGPPGTGKTQTILNILANMIIQNKTVAVVSNNNSAVDNVFEKMDKKGFGFLIASLGNRANQERFIDNQVDYPKMDDWYLDQENLNKSIDELKMLERKLENDMQYQDDIKKLKYERSLYITEKNYFDRMIKNNEIEFLNKISYYHLNSKRIIDILANLKIDFDNEQEKSRFLLRLKWIFKFGVKNIHKIKDNEGINLYLQSQYYVNKINEIDKAISNKEAFLRKNNFEIAKNKYDKLAERVFKAFLYNKYGKKKSNRHKMKLHTYLKGEYLNFINEYPITLSTTFSIKNSMNNQFLFDYIIVDESSQVDLLTAGLVMSSCRNIIIVGDDKQLPQIIPKAIIKKDYDIFEKYGINDCYNYSNNSFLDSILRLYNMEKNHEVYTLLKEHYRCNPKIIGFCNKKYYDNQLIIHTQEKNEPSLYIFRTVPGNHMRNIIVGKRGKYNQREIDVIDQEILNIVEQENKEILENIDINDIGIISPYRKQINKMSCIDKNIEKDTVHKFQGREKKVIIFSSVIDKTRAGQMGIKFVSNPNLVNVAVSRAIDKFILVSDANAISKTNNDLADLIYYIEYYSEDSKTIDSKLVSVFDLLYNEYSDCLQKLSEKVDDNTNSKYKSERIIDEVIQEVLKKDEFNNLKYTKSYKLNTLLKKEDGLSEKELKYLHHPRTEVDFMIYNNMGNRPILGIEVNGTTFHENKIEQIWKDDLKKKLFEMNNLNLYVIKTNEITNTNILSDKIREALMKINTEKFL